MLYIWDMINHKELRWGNLVQDDWGRIQEVLWFDNSGVETEHARFQYEVLSPIPLTNEVIEKCGFTNKRDDHYYTEYELKVVTGWDDTFDEETYRICHIIKGKKPDDVWNFYFDGIHVIPCEHLHDLQNGFWCVYRKELKYEV
jgi:hypothetical protein